MRRTFALQALACIPAESMDRLERLRVSEVARPQDKQVWTQEKPRSQLLFRERGLDADEHRSEVQL